MMIVPTLCVGMQPGTLCVPLGRFTQGVLCVRGDAEREERSVWRLVIVPTLCVGMQPGTLCVPLGRFTQRVLCVRGDAERPDRHSHAERE